MTPMKKGFWLVKCCMNCPWAPARLYLCGFEPGVPENLLDRSPYWRGQIALDEADPIEVWQMVEFIESSSTERQDMAEGIGTAPMARWKQGRAIRISRGLWESQMRDWSVGEIDPRKPVKIEQLALPEFREA